MQKGVLYILILSSQIQHNSSRRQHLHENKQEYKSAISYENTDAIDYRYNWQFAEYKMKSIKLESQIIKSKVTSCFQHPTHYVTIIQTQNESVKLYDQKTMSIKGQSNKNYSQLIKCVAFTENFNMFYAYFQGRMNLRSSTYNPYFVKMELKQDSVIYCQTIFIRDGNFNPNEGFLNIAYLNNQQSYEQPILAFINGSYCYFISLKGQIIKKNPIAPEILSIPYFRVQKCIYMKNGEFLISFKQFLFVYKIKAYQGTLHKMLSFQDQIQHIFLDSTPTPKYISIVTKDQTVYILSKSSKQMYVKYTAGMSYFKPILIDFFYLSPNSSSTNKYKNLVFFIFQGSVTLKKQKRLINEQINQSQLRSGLSSSSSFCSKNLYIYSFEEIHDDTNKDQQKHLTLKQLNIFYMKNIGLIKGLYNNCHQLNSIMILSQQNQLASYDLKNIFDEKIDQKWIYWVYNYQATKKHELQYYQQQEEEFQKNINDYKSTGSTFSDRNLSQNYLNDWSLSCLPKQIIKNAKTTRLNVLEF